MIKTLQEWRAGPIVFLSRTFYSFMGSKDLGEEPFSPSIIQTKHQLEVLEKDHQIVVLQ